MLEHVGKNHRIQAGRLERGYAGEICGQVHFRIGIQVNRQVAAAFENGGKITAAGAHIQDDRLRGKAFRSFLQELPVGLPPASAQLRAALKFIERHQSLRYRR